jgi:RNA polymerase sigma factor (sigma-70 family)
MMRRAQSIADTPGEATAELDVARAATVSTAVASAAAFVDVEAASFASPVEVEPSIISHYFQDVRRFPLLSHEREIALAQQIQEGNRQWREELVQRLLHVPLLLAWRARLRRGIIPITALCLPDHAPTLVDLVARLDHLQRLRCQMRRLVQELEQGGEGVTPRITAVRADMRALLQPLEWQPAFLQQAWFRFDTAMAAASPARQRRQTARFVSTLGSSLEILRRLWRELYRIQTGVERAKQEMITRNLRLVISVAREFSYTGMPLTDLIQEGNIGLMRAVDKFDYRRNLKFSTYAIWWIKQAMRRAVFEQSSLIRIPEYMYESVRRVYKSQQELSSTLGRLPTTQEIAQHLDMPMSRVERSLDLVREPVSLDRPLWDDETRTLGEVLADVQTSTSQEVMAQQSLIDHTQRALEGLSPREAEVIRRRFGLHGKPGETLRQIGEDLHLSHERVRQIEAEALAKLRHQSTALQGFLEP